MKNTPWKIKIGATLAALWMRTLRIRVHAPADFRPGVLGLWHQDLLASTAAFRDKGVHILVSESGDGEFFTQAAQKLGYTVTRGSDTHGSTNVRHVLKALKQGTFVGMALDGPHGPDHQVKPGSIWLSRSSGTPLWLFQFKYGRHIRLKSWDKFIIPLPMTTIDLEIKYLYDVQKEYSQSKA